MLIRHELKNLLVQRSKILICTKEAFTHKSAIKEYEQFTESFETLEFIGDSVLGFVITKFLFDRYESRQEGFLTKARTKLVRGETLAKIANTLNLNELVIMDEKGMRNQWNNNPKILEDVFEALIGAIYMDIGLIHAKEFILRIYQDPEIVDMNSIMVDDNYKDHLMRHCQVNNWPLPEYRVCAHHEGLFYIDIYIDNMFRARGAAKSKKQAEQNAAQMYFQVLDEVKKYNYN